MARVPRHLFVPPEQQPYAYENRPLPIGHGQTISQPYMVALMTDLLKLGNQDRVLEIGTGSGYQAAVLAELVRSVYTIEIVAPLATEARARLDRLIPVGPAGSIQSLTLIEKQADGTVRTNQIIPVRFVPLTRER